MQFQIDQQPWGLLVRLSGNFDSSSLFEVSDLEDALLVQYAGMNVVFELSGLGFMDSTGLGRLVSIIGNFRQNNRQVALAAPSESVLRVFNLTSLDKVLPITGSVDEAVAALGQ